jgi:hypothetical protein
MRNSSDMNLIDFSQNNMTIDEFKDALEPPYNNLDHIIEDIIRPMISVEKFKYFEACRFKMKAIYYIQKKVETLDSQYRKFLSLCIAKDALHKLSLTASKDCYFYVPFYEAFEFENLLSQGKACLDCFSKAIGSMYNESPNNIDKLVNVLKLKPKNHKIDKLLRFIRESYRLNGVLIDPMSKGKKSIRDIISHRERIDIFFSIRLDRNTGKYVLSDGALLNMRHPEISQFPNYFVTVISAKVWYLLLGIIENCFKVQFIKSNAPVSNTG